MDRLSRALIGTFLLLATRNASADVYYPDDATIDTVIQDPLIIVGYDNYTDYVNRTNGTSPTVNLVDGSSVTQMAAESGSTINVMGGIVGELGAGDSGTINLSGGEVITLGIGTSATLNISGGTTDYGPFTLDSSTLIMSGGEVGTYNETHPNYTGGPVSIEDQSTAILDGGTIYCGVGVSGFSQALANNMTIVGAVQTSDFASFTMTSGTIGSLSINNESTATVTGGTIVGSMNSYSGQTSSASGTTISSVTGFAGTMSLSGTTITGNVDAYLGTVNVSGGTIGGNATSDMASSGGPAIPLSLDGGVAVAGIVSATNIGTIAIYNATVTGDVEAHQQGVVGMSDGTLNGGVNTYDSGSFILDGGTVNGDLHAYDQSTITVNGGTITGTLTDNGGQYYSSNTGITVTGGTIANLAANDSRSVTMSGGTIQNSLTAQSGSFFTLTGGSVNGTATGYDNSTVHIDGATVTNIVAHDYSNFDLLSGTVNGSIQVHDFGSVNISGGNVYGFLTEDGYGGATLSGGRIGNDATLSNYSSLSISGTGAIGGNVAAHDFSDISMSGGTITGNVDFYDNSGFYWSGGHVQGIISMHDQSFLDWTGGTFGASNTGPHFAPADAPADSPTPIYVYDSASLEIDGINLSSTLVNANANGFSLYSLAGYLGDGSALSSDIHLYIQNPTSTTTGGSLQLGHAQQQWNIANGGSWATAANWLANLVPNEAGASVMFSDAGYVENPTDNHVTLDDTYTVGTLTFNTVNNIILDPGTGGALILDNQGASANIYVITGHPQINTSLVLPANTTILVGQNDEDTVRLARSAAITANAYYDYVSLSLNTGLTIPAGGSVAKIGVSPLYTTFVRGGNLDIEEGTVQIVPNGTPAATSRLEGFNVPYEGVLDLTNNDLIIDYTAGNSPLNTIQEYLAAGYDGGYWDGAGIISSAAGGNPDLSTALGYADNTLLGLTSFDGQSVDANVILIKYTWLGDANLDGIVNFADLAMMSSTGTTWSSGDFNYDGVVNADDYTLFMLGDAESGGINISATLPEPGVWLAAFGLLPTLRRYRRR